MQKIIQLSNKTLKRFAKKSKIVRFSHFIFWKIELFFVKNWLFLLTCNKFIVILN